MPPRQKIALLPDDLRAELDRRLINHKFSNYKEMEEWLNAELARAGLEITISHAAIHRYGVQFSERLNRLNQSTQMAKAVAETVGDDKGALIEAVQRLGQEHLFQLLLALEQGGDDAKDLIPKFTRAIADISRAALAQGKWKEEFKSKLASKIDEIEASPAVSVAEALARVRQEAYGL